MTVVCKRPEAWANDGLEFRIERYFASGVISFSRKHDSKWKENIPPAYGIAPLAFCSWKSESRPLRAPLRSFVATNVLGMDTV